jgi:hypothetical protein
MSGKERVWRRSANEDGEADTAPLMAAFDQGQPPTIAFVNKATVPLGVDFDALIGALGTFLTQNFLPVWGTPATFIKSDKQVRNAWAMLFLDDPDAAGALGYHDLTKDGLPLSKVFVKTTLAAGELVSVTACHELCEMLVDPAINMWALGPKNVLYAYEMCDACEEETFPVNGIAMSDFVYPSFFERFRLPGSAKFDHLGKITAPFETLRGGYQIVHSGGRDSQIFGRAEDGGLELPYIVRPDGSAVVLGSVAKAVKYEAEDRRQHRSEYREEEMA